MGTDELHFRSLLAAEPGCGEAWLGLADVYRSRGDVEAAAETLRRAATCLRNPVAAFLSLGQLYVEAGRLDDAVDAFRSALCFDPGDVEALADVADALHRLGRLPEAEAAYQKLVQAAPQSAEAHNNYGNFLGEIGRVDEAIAALTHAVQLGSEIAEIHNNLGAALRKANLVADAIFRYRQALELRPDFAEAHNNLANALVQLQRPDEAMHHFREALVHRPDYVDAWFNFGNALRQIGSTDESAAAFREALRHCPNHAEALVGLGNAVRDLGRWGDAAESYQRAIRARPEAYEAYFNLGSLLLQQGRLDESLARLHQADRLRPGHSGIHSALGLVAMDQGLLDEALRHFQDAFRLGDFAPNDASNLLFCLEHLPDVSRMELFDQHLRLGRRFAGANPQPPVVDRRSNRRLRIGYVSPDFRTHVAMRFIEPILKHHDAARFEVFAYAESPAVDEVTRRLQTRVSAWRTTLGQNDEAVAQRIRDDRIDILVDLAGHTSHHRLGVFGLRPAPIQATYLGYPDTTGVPGIDYRFTDSLVDPPGADAFATETLIRLPRGFCCLEPLAEDPVAPYAERAFTFGSMHRLSRLNSRVLDAWCKILRQTSGTRLIVLRHTLTGTTRDRFRREFGRRGIAHDRVELRSDFGERSTHLAVYGEIDLLLDTFPWSGHATACEALWMGVPPLTLLADRPAGRMVASVLTQVGLRDFIAADVADYVRRGVALAKSPERVRGLRSDLRERLRSNLCDSAAFTRDLESAYEMIWRDRLSRPPSPSGLRSETSS